MTELSGRERILKALNLKEPDSVPHFELGIDPKVRQAILPGAGTVDFVEKMGIDAIVIFDKAVAWKYETVDESKRIVRDHWGGLAQFGAEMLAHPIEPAIKSEKDLEGYKPPDPDEEWRYERLKQIIRRLGGEKAVFAHVTDVFDIASDSLLGLDNYLRAMIKNPDLLDRVNEIVLDYNLRYIKNCLELGADALLISGDFAMTEGPFVSPRHTARFLTPALKKQVDLAHKMHVPAVKHTDGNLWKIMDLLIETGIDGLHPIDPIAGMDLGEVKARYGDRLCLLGNVNCGPTLTWGTTEEVRQEVKECMKKAAHGGGYICMSSNSIHSSVKPENYLAMIKAIREFGKYPLELS